LTDQGETSAWSVFGYFLDSALRSEQARVPAYSSFSAGILDRIEPIRNFVVDQLKGLLNGTHKHGIQGSNSATTNR
jgi:hypothetical protein